MRGHPRPLTRILGALVGGLVPLVLSAGITWISALVGVRLEHLVGLLHLGAPAGFMCGGLFGPRAVATTLPWRLGVGVAFIAVPITFAIVVFGNAVASAREYGTQPDVAYLLLSGLYYLVLVYPIGMTIAVPSALFAIFALRWIARLTGLTRD